MTKLTPTHTHTCFIDDGVHISPILLSSVCPSVLPTVLMGFTWKLLLFLSSPTISLFFPFALSIRQPKLHWQSFSSPALSVSLCSTLQHTHTHTRSKPIYPVMGDSDLCLPCDRIVLQCVSLWACVPAYVCSCGSSCLFTLVLIISRLQSGLPGPVNLLIDLSESLGVDGKLCERVCVFGWAVRTHADTAVGESVFSTSQFKGVLHDTEKSPSVHRLESAFSHLKSIARSETYACRREGKGMKGAESVRVRRFILKGTVSSGISRV